MFLFTAAQGEEMLMYTMDLPVTGSEHLYIGHLLLGMVFPWESL